MTYDPRYKKMKMSGAKKLWLVLAAFYFVCIIAIVYIWLYYNKNIPKTESDLLETENSADAVIKDQLDTVSEFGGKKIGELVDHMVKSASPGEESQTDTSSSDGKAPASVLTASFPQTIPMQLKTQTNSHTLRFMRSM